MLPPPQQSKHFSVRPVQALPIQDIPKMPRPRIDDIINREALVQKLRDISHRNRREQWNHDVQSQFDEPYSIAVEPQDMDPNAVAEWERLTILQQLVEAYDGEDAQQSSNQQGLNSTSNMANTTSNQSARHASSTIRTTFGGSSLEKNPASFPFPTPTSTSQNPVPRAPVVSDHRSLARPTHTPIQRPLPPICTQITQNKSQAKQNSPFFTRPAPPTPQVFLPAPTTHQQIPSQQVRAPATMPPPQTRTARLLRPFATPMSASRRFNAVSAATPSYSTAAQSPFFNPRVTESIDTSQSSRQRNFSMASSFGRPRRGMVEGSPWIGRSRDARFLGDLGIEGRRSVRR
jgi:hypothetical protein